MKKICVFLVVSGGKNENKNFQSNQDTSQYEIQHGITIASSISYSKLLSKFVFVFFYQQTGTN